MDNLKHKVKGFLDKYGMNFKDINMEESCDTFIKEMENGLEGQQSSLKMIPTYITMDKEIPTGEPVIVMDAGGTNFRVAVVTFDSNKKPIIEDYKLYSMPGINGEISREEFFTTIVQYIKPVLKRSNKIGFCFSYPTEILPSRDGRLIQFSKEVRVKDLIGDLIGEGLVKTIKDMGLVEDKKIVLLNDTVATLLGGKAAYPDREFESFIGFILGTGTNTCYIEQNRNIVKTPEFAQKEGSMLINVESGAYGRAQGGILDSEFDKGTSDPGEYKFEKMISGRYQGGIILTVIKKAAEDGLFSGKFSGLIKEINELTTEEVSNYLYYPYSDNKLSMCCLEGSDDQLVLYYLIDAMIERAARFVTINLASIMIKMGIGKNPCRPVCITADGSTFYKLKSFRNKLDYYVKKYLNDEKGLYCEFVKAENGTLVGAAIAGLTNN